MLKGNHATKKKKKDAYEDLYLMREPNLKVRLSCELLSVNQSVKKLYSFEVSKFQMTRSKD